MYIIKLNAIGSTNTYLKEMAVQSLPKDYTAVTADLQTEGRGQMGTNWQGNEGENLMASVFKRTDKFEISSQFYISMVVALAISNALKTFKLSKIRVKWPNDILSADKKICGILIENIIKNNRLQASVIGFGLNVNQKFFDNLPKASSMYLQTGIVYDRDEILSEILNQLKTYFQILEKGNFSKIKSDYESLLFRKDKPSTFKNPDNETFTGIIKGITEDGRLKVLVEDEIIEIYDLKEISLMY